MKFVSYGKRGMLLESMIEYSNQTYKQKGIALIDKIPTNWKVYFDKATQKVRNAFPEKKGTVDFIGVSKGKSIAFDAKSTQSKTSFALKNVEEHQMRYLLEHQKHGGVSFFIVYFEKHDEAYFLTIDQYYEWYKAMLGGGRKSIPHKWFQENCPLIKSRNGIALDYLEHVFSVHKEGVAQ